jgi:hypothetical protein
MRWMMVGTMIAVGSLAATAVRAQESDGATATQQSAQSNRPAYGTYVKGPATIDADGVPVANPNPMSRFLDGADELPFAMPLVDPPPTDASGTNVQTK